MEFISPKDKLAYMLDKGLVRDIYLARQSHALLMALGHRGPELEGQPYTRFFMQLQSILADHFIVHVTKLFEPARVRYPNISIPSVLDVIDDNKRSLVIIEKELVQQNLAHLGVSIDPWSLTSEEVTDAISAHFHATLPTVNGSQALSALRALRDKRIAHRDAADISALATTTYGESFKLVQYAEDFTCVIGPAYLSKLYGIASERFFLTDDARMTSNSLEHLVDLLLTNRSTKGA